MAKSKAPIVTAVVVGVVAVVAVKLIVGGGGSEKTPGATPSDAGRDTSGCVSLTVAASSEKAALLGRIASAYEDTDPEVGGTCVAVEVTSVASGGGEQALARGWDEELDGPRPDVWTPAASTWVGLLQQDLAAKDKPDLVPDETPSIASTPLVLAMPRPMAQALGWPAKSLGWSDVLSLVEDQRGWAALGHPEWGRFTLGKTNPNLSTSGLAATIGSFVAATGKSSDLTDRDLEDPRVRRFVQTVERSVVHYGDTTLTYLSNLQRADDRGASLGYVSAVAVEEKSVLDYNNGNPTGDPATLGDHEKPAVPLAAIYPKEGTLFSDSPWVTLDAPWVDEDKRAASADLLSYLRSAKAQKVFTDAGFRTYDGKPGKPITTSEDLIADGVKVTLSPPAPAVLSQVRSAWTQLRKPARVLMLLDVSGSMGEPVPDAGASKLELAKRAAIRAMTQFAPTDEVGLWAFTTDLDGEEQIYRELEPVLPISRQRDDLRRSIRSLTPLNGTPLYAAIRAAVGTMGTSLDADKINAVVVLTDGRNEYPADTDLAGLVRQLGGGSSESPDTSLRVFTIAYGEGADLETLRQISAASNAAAYDATRPESIDKVFTAVLSNF
ncbi:substrate-binding and VWA domain-containing protein [Nocardioides marmoribigeumensis]|uniref:Ca-activated chloride channel family protein n=1 Tax=Nocardioides marmoribigeumensis TaxID=433649 RepID=A0ABU2BWR2_9ACTN|nr:substrate-binding and VWA domain-containing protein [Nocardioides marmoribigeumensis]MDR7362458.1 Ca-activated chloride channel family protein [Nocardioides marmoribigeumensis]